MLLPYILYIPLVDPAQVYVVNVRHRRALPEIPIRGIKIAPLLPRIAGKRQVLPAPFLSYQPLNRKKMKHHQDASYTQVALSPLQTYALFFHLMGLSAFQDRQLMAS